MIRFSPPGLRVTVTSDRTSAPATTSVTATVVVKNTSDVTTPPGRLTLTEGEGVMYAHKGETDNGTFGTIEGRQNVVYFDIGAFAPGEQKTFEVPLMIVPLIDTADMKVKADFSVGAPGTFGETKALEITATPITAVQDTSAFADLIGLPVADLGTNPDGPPGQPRAPGQGAAIEAVYPSDKLDQWSLYVTESLSRWSRKDKTLYFTLKKAGFSARSAYAAVYLRSLMDLRPSGSCIPSGLEMAKASVKVWYAVQQAKWFKGKETSFFSAFENVAAGLGGCSALYPMNLLEFHDKYTTPLIKVMKDSLARFGVNPTGFRLQVCNYLVDDIRMTVPLARLVEADIDYRVAKGVYHPILHDKVLTSVDVRDGAGGSVFIGEAIRRLLEDEDASGCDVGLAMQRRGKAVSIQVHSPLMPVVTDASGRKSGVDAQARVVYDEIPGAMMAPGHPWSIHLPASGAPFQVAWTTAYGGAFGIDIQGQTNGVTTSTQSLAGGAIRDFTSSQTITVSLDAGRVIASATTGTLNRPIGVAALTATLGTWMPGQRVEFVATVTGTGGSPTGSVTFMDGATTLGVVSLVGGEARHATTALSAGNHRITAVYSGDATFAGSTSPEVSQVVPAQLTLGDARVTEGQTGASYAVFTATLSAASTSTATASYTTGDGTATSSDYVASSGVITFFPGETSKTLTVPARGDTTAEGDETFSVVLSSPTNATLAKSTGEGVILNDDGAATTIPRLVNISTRGLVGTGDNIMIGGFIVGGFQSKKVVIRGRGPSLAAFGVPGTLADPAIRLYSGATPIEFNDDWQQATNAADITASGQAPSDPKEAAILTTVSPNVPYTVHLTGVGETQGIAIVEVFELDKPEVPLLNISTRGPVLTGDHVMIGGFIIQGDAAQQVLIVAKGPSLGVAPFNVPGSLPDPTLELYQAGVAAPIDSNDNWPDSASAAAIQASGNAPMNALESAILRTLPPGAYTAIVRGKEAFQGIGLVEVYKK